MSTPENPIIKPAIPLLVITSLVVVVNMILGYLGGIRMYGPVSGALGSATSQVVLPIIVALIFSIAKKYRTPKAKTYVVLAVSGILLLSHLVKLANFPVESLDATAQRLSKACPKMLDQMVRLDGFEAINENVWIAKHTVVGVEKASVNMKIWNETFKPNIRGSILKNDHVKALLRKGIKVIYRYRDAKGIVIDDITFTIGDLK
jgi:hypothetical protein